MNFSSINCIAPLRFTIERKVGAGHSTDAGVGRADSFKDKMVE
jgi:hypothetical protein